MQEMPTQTEHTKQLNQQSQHQPDEKERYKETVNYRSYKGVIRYYRRAVTSRLMLHLTKG